MIKPSVDLLIMINLEFPIFFKPNESKFIFCFLFLPIVLFIWVILKITRFLLSIALTKKYSYKKENRKRKTGMEIMDADYEEVE